MTEAEFLIVRIIPTKPVGAEAFRKALEKINITAWDKRVSDAEHDRPLGNATGLAGRPEDQPVIPPYPAPPPRIPGVGFTSPDKIKYAIIQHYTVRQVKHSLRSVATAVIVIDRSKLEGPDKEYPEPTSYDVRLELTQDLPQNTIASRQTTVDYNVRIKKAHLSDSQVFYMAMGTDIYLSVDVPISPLLEGTSVLGLSREGVPPAFDSLRKSINSVINKDSSAGAESLEGMTNFLSTAQAKRIASELTTNRLLDPPPQAPYPTSTGDDTWSVPEKPPDVIFEDMFTDTGGSIPREIEQARLKFEGERASYYGLRSSDSIQLSNYVYSAIAAVYAEYYTSKAGYAVVQVPVQDQARHSTAIAMPSMFLMGDNGGGIVPAFTVPAAYFYALMTTYAISQDCDTRLKLLLTTPRDTLTVSLNLAIDAGVLGSRDRSDNLIHYKSTLNSSNNVNINELQALRRIIALQASVRAPTPGQVVVSKNETVKRVITNWLQFSGQEDMMASEVWFKNDLDYLIMLFEIIAPGEEALISKMLEDLRKAPPPGVDLGDVVKNVSDLLSVTEQQWLQFFERHSELMPDEYLLGDLKQRVHAFVQHITKVIFVFPPPSASEGNATQPPTPHLGGSLTHDVLVHFFNSYQNFAFDADMDASKVEEMKVAALLAFDNDAVVSSFVVDAAVELWFLYRVTNLTGTDKRYRFAHRVDSDLFLAVMVQTQPISGGEAPEESAVTQAGPISNELRFSYMEALHARGFVRAERIQSVARAAFIRAMSGTVAYTRAGEIHDEALKLPRDDSPYNPEPGNSFQPINGGGLTDCEPPCHLSPFGPVQYLSHLLKFSFSEDTIASLLSTRRSDSRQLMATETNLGVPVPLVDIVNENLEYIVAGRGQGGPVHNTIDNYHNDLDIPNGPEFRMSQEISIEDSLRALPQHSTSKMPLEQPEAYAKLKSSAAGSELPYERGADVSSTYLEALASSRYEILRTFSRDITEFAQDASKEPSEFQKQLRRLPVRYPVALSFLGITPAEETLIFSGKMATSTAMELLGIGKKDETYPSKPFMVSEFILQAGITYCDFLALHQSNFIKFGPRKPALEFPKCLPCCDEKLSMQFDGEEPQNVQLLRLAIFVRLWRRVSHHHTVSMVVLGDICKILGLFGDQNVNPEFLRQLASLLMIQAHWSLPWTSNETAPDSQAPPYQRTRLLAIWSGQAPTTSEFKWALSAIINGIKYGAKATYSCPDRSAEWERLLVENFETIALLSGFDKDHKWSANPTSTIRFMEILSKIYASEFTIGEIVFIFTTYPHLRSDDPFPSTEEDESLDDPFNVPEDVRKQGLWALRRRLLDVEVCDAEIEQWSWPKIEAMLYEMGYAPHGEVYSLVYLAEHFFPEILAEQGIDVPEENRRFTATLNGTSTPSIWGPLNACTPFFYSRPSESEYSSLWAKLPLSDDEVLEALRKTRQLSNSEAAAVQKVYLKPRTALAPFALLFSNFNEAARTMTEEKCVYRRFKFFQREISIFYKRCKAIAHHIHDAVRSAARDDSAECCSPGFHDHHDCDGLKVAWKVLLNLIADENRPFTSWESDNDEGGAPQDFTWHPHFSGGAFAALLGICGTGIEGIYLNSRKTNQWRETRGPLIGWGTANNFWNAPLPTLVPGLTLMPSETQDDFVAFKNGFAYDQSSGDLLSGAESFTALWSGTLLIEDSGCYEFALSCPLHANSPDGRSCNCICSKFKQWAFKLQRGQKIWTLLEHGNADVQGDDAPASRSRLVSLRRGAYQATLVFQQPEPNFDDEDDLKKLKTGFVLQYNGPDTDNCLKVIPLHSLYVSEKDGPLWGGEERAAAIMDPLALRYVPTIRDMRRTYQRAFKSVLFAYRFCLSARIMPCEQESELGFLLKHPEEFRGTSYYWTDDLSSVKVHRVNFDFNFLPVVDAYNPPEKTVDPRVDPSSKRIVALFDWWERLFDYVKLREKVRKINEPEVWLLFYHADDGSASQPVNHLMRFLGISITDAPLALEYFATEADGGLFRITDSQNLGKLSDERWTERVWQAGRWLHRVQKHFYAPPSEWTFCRPALWATHPDADTPTLDGTSGNLNLLRFVQRSCMGQNEAVPRLSEIIRLNDGLRLRARQSMLQLLLGEGITMEDLSDRLLIDVEAGLDESSSRVIESIHAIQRFVQRLLMGLESSTQATPAEEEKWNCALATFEKWKLLQKKIWYYENWIQWDESTQFRQSESFKSMTRSLTGNVSTVAKTSRNMSWTGVGGLPTQPGMKSLAGAQYLSLRTQTQALDEGVALIGAPGRSGQPSWIASVTPLVAKDPPTNSQGVEERRLADGSLDAKDDEKSLASHVSDAPEIAEAEETVALPAATSLESIPLWIQAVLDLGVRFIRVAASGLPISYPYEDLSATSSLFCCDCGKEHPPVIDEYYFWLQDARRYDPAQVPAPQDADAHNNIPGFSSEPRQGAQVDPRTIQSDPTSDWDSPTPQMLWWQSTPIVHLHWTRVHMGLLRDHRRSTEGIPLSNDSELSSLFLNLRGRHSDSLFFDVKSGDSVTGFRYDIATDTAIPIPEPVASSPSPDLPLALELRERLSAFPYFLYFSGGAPLVPVATYSISLAISRSLRDDCQYSSSTKWLRSCYDPLNRDNTWMQCRELSLRGRSSEHDFDQSLWQSGNSTDLFSRTDVVEAAPENTESESHTVEDSAAPERFPQDRNCCDTAPVARGKARGRAATLEYIETLSIWAENLLAQNSLESEQSALTILSIANKILGEKPRVVDASDLSQGQMTVAAFQANPPALNPRLMYLYEKIGDRLNLIRQNLNLRRLQAGNIFKDRSLAAPMRRVSPISSSEICGPSKPILCESLCSFSCGQNYRFTAILPRAAQWVGMVKATGAALLGAFERGDSEALTSLKATQDRQITELGREVSQNQYRAADWDVQALDKQMQSALTKLEYYQKLIREGLNFNETGFIFGTTASMASRTSANVSESIGQGMASTPDMWVGIAGTMGTPLQFQQMPMGVKLGTGFAAAARILNTVADVSSSSAGLHSTLGGWDRREQEWQHQADLTVYEIQQIKRQRLAARRRLEISLRELNNTERRIQHSAETHNFLASKFTKYELWLYLQQENASLYRQMYNIATDVCREAEQAARYELGDYCLDFIPSSVTAWNNLHEGLLAGEKLELSLSSLERAYMNKNCREYELAKHISLRLHFPAAFVLLKSVGYCEIDIPEHLFDLDYPGQFMRRVKTVSLTIPCVAGPYTGVHCRLQQVRSSIRVRPAHSVCSTCCCDKPKKENDGQLSCKHDPEVITRFAGTEAIATSSGQNDSGLFEVSFSDARYLPFEYSGAISRWRIELPPEDNQFDLDSLSDVVMHMNYTAREGGPEFRKECQVLAKKRSKEHRVRFLDIKHELPEVWSAMRRKPECPACEHTLTRPGCCDHCSSQKSEKVNWKCTCDEGGYHSDGHSPRGSGLRHGSVVGHRSRKMRHQLRRFQLQLSRQMFPFISGCTNLTVNAIQIFLDLGECSSNSGEQIGVVEMLFIYPNGGKCPETERIVFVETAGGIWKGTLCLAKPVSVAGEGCREQSSWTSGKTSIGTFDMECDIKNVRKAWILCIYDTKQV
ncbi:hypothetical protein NLG97_g3228 [Lecanicillium saksenae]|uniref:Uncharacterized protein n=1 Tax=Lecanicillium saksenae TaxID=468837 RepID=A0ACC1QZY1_9HYPO|nr:hypothetical protein NLG97_g3228 [Lecanicillium saksenae]